MDSPDASLSPWRATLAAFCALLVGIGLARFAYTPLIPPLIAEGWFTPGGAAYLGAANLAGYLAGALVGRRLAVGRSAATVLRPVMLLATLAFFACAVPLSFLWFFAWRFAAGFAGAVLMVLAAPSVLPHVPAARHGLASGLIFAGVGLGIAASGTVVPLFLRLGLTEAWIGLGLMALVLTLAAWGGWPKEPIAAAPAAAPHAGRVRTDPALAMLYVGYGLCAAGLVPHMVFLVDFIARGLEQGLEAGARYWVLFGIGAMLGPVLVGQAADRMGFRRALRLAYAAQALAVALPVVSTGPAAMMISSLAIGAFVPGISSLALGRMHELTADDARARRAGWSVATAGFACGQAIAAYGFSYLYARTGGYDLLFGLGAGAFLLALALDLAGGARRRSNA
ncbi:MAG: MFS transporter [Xanthobacteraceae bacterium]|nr:MFS transporter [Xanthobacteraceae bacterium]